jgi:tRNA(Ile)-lysidine synthase
MTSIETPGNATKRTTAKTHTEIEDCLWLAAMETGLPRIGWPQVPYTGIYRLNVPGEVMLTGDWQMVTEIVNDPEVITTNVFNNPDPFQAYLDLDSLKLPLVVRTRLPGDRFHSLGMGQRSVKVADLMINAKLPYRARERWPLLLSGEEVIWVPGIQIGHKFRINENTKFVLRIRVIKTDK